MIFLEINEMIYQFIVLFFPLFLNEQKIHIIQAVHCLNEKLFENTAEQVVPN